ESAPPRRPRGGTWRCRSSRARWADPPESPTLAFHEEALLLLDRPPSTDTRSPKASHDAWGWFWRLPADRVNPRVCCRGDNGRPTLARCPAHLRLGGGGVAIKPSG